MAEDIPLGLIEPNPNQPRRHFPDDYIEGLAASIKRRGLIQPITLRPLHRDGESPRYMIVAGECRWRAHKLLGRATIRANVVAMTRREMQRQAIVENLQRKDMNAIEEARAFQTLIDEGDEPADIVRELGLKSTAIVHQRLVLLNLTEEIQQLVITGQLQVTMAWGVAQVSQARQTQLVRDIASGKLRTAEAVKHAAFAIRDAEAQMDAFADAPQATAREIGALSRLEHKVDQIADMVALGFKDGECIAAHRVSPDRVVKVADRLKLIRRHVLQMEHELRRVATQAEFRLERQAAE